MLTAQAKVPTEISFTASAGYGDIANDVEVDVVFEGARGASWKMPAFWAGGNVFAARFSAPEPGRYKWRSVCSNKSDSGLHGRKGEIEVSPYAGGCRLYEHGRIRVAKSKRTLEHEDGTPFFWMGDTWWMGLARRLDWPHGFRELVQDRVAKGFNVIQIVCGPFPDFCATVGTWNPQQTNEGGWPWEKDFTRINPAYYDFADIRFAYLIEHGLMPCIVGMWGYYLPFMGVEKAKKHWRNLVARYAAYPVVWCIAGEAVMPTYAYHGKPEFEEKKQEQLEGWTQVTEYVRKIDPYQNAVTLHPDWARGARDQVKDASLVDFDMLQTGHGGYGILGHTVQQVQEKVRREPRIPVLNGEPCYEGIMGSGWQEMQRFLFWTAITTGACGHTYGAQGMWAMSSRDEPFLGTTANWGDGYWQDVMHYAGSKQVALGRRFFEQYPWQNFEPMQEPLPAELKREYAFATGIPGKIAVYYLPALCVDNKLQGMRGGAVTIPPDADYSGYFFNPRTEARVEYGAVKPGASGRWPIPQCPSMEDWVLVLENRKAL